MVERFGSQPSEDNPREQALEAVAEAARPFLDYWFDEGWGGRSRKLRDALTALDALAPSPDPEGEQR